MRAFVFFVVIAVASGARAAPPSLNAPGPAGRRALGAIAQKVKNVRPPVSTVIKNVKPQRIVPPTGPVAKNTAPRPNLATRNAMPPAAEHSVMKTLMKPRRPAAEGGVMNSIMNGGKNSSKPSGSIMNAIMSGNLSSTHSDQPLSDNPLAVAGQEGMVKIDGVDLQFGTEDAKAALESMNWNPSSEDANKILQNLACWPGQPPCDEKRSAIDWVKDYIGTDEYSANVCKVTRGDLASVSDRSPAACFNSNSVTAEQATGCAFEFGVALSAALSLVEAPSVQEPVYRGAKLPLDFVQELAGLAGGKETFSLGGMTSTSRNEDYATRFMYRTGTSDDVCVFYEINTAHATSVDTALGAESGIIGKRGGKPQEWESIVRPAQQFEVVSVKKVPRANNVLEHYRVILQDPAGF